MFSKYFQYLMKKRHFATLNDGEVKSTNYYLRRYRLNSQDYWGATRRQQKNVLPYLWSNAEYRMKQKAWKARKQLGLKKYYKKFYNKRWSA